MIGKILYQTRKRFDGGLATSWYREIIRKKILKLPPITNLNDVSCEIHVLTSEDDWLNSVWAIRSFYRFSKRKYRLVIHDDGSLRPNTMEKLLNCFPDSRLISREMADAEVSLTLQEYPLTSKFRETSLFAPKIIDFHHYLGSEKMLSLDSDVLFFDEPTALLAKIDEEGYRRNLVNRDIKSAYTVDPEDVIEKFGFKVIERFNAGFGLIHRDSIDLEWIEEFLHLPNIRSNEWRVEQTLYALLSSRFGVEHLPSEYDIFVEGNVGTRPMRHYVGRIRDLMYREGMKKLQQNGMLLG